MNRPYLDISYINIYVSGGPPEYIIMVSGCLGVTLTRLFQIHEKALHYVVLLYATHSCEIRRQVWINHCQVHLPIAESQFVITTGETHTYVKKLLPYQLANQHLRIPTTKQYNVLHIQNLSYNHEKLTNISVLQASHMCQLAIQYIIYLLQGIEANICN